MSAKACGKSFPAESGDSGSARPVGLQLYTLRESIAADLDATWDFVGSLGLNAVEPYRLVGQEDELAARLAAHALAAPSVHAPILSDDQRAILEAAQRLGIGTVIQPAVDKVFWADEQGVAALAGQLNAAAAVAEEYGVAVGYHNHAFEFEHLDRPLHRLTGQLDERVRLEVDTYWTAVGGSDPVAVLRELGERVGFIHIKDGPISAEMKQLVPLGQGRLPVPEILAAAPHALALVELDDHDGDMLAAVSASIEYLRSIA